MSIPTTLHYDSSTPSRIAIMTNNPRSMQDLLKKKIDEIRNCIVNGPPYCQGTVSVPGSDLSLFYGTEGNAQ